MFLRSSLDRAIVPQHQLLAGANNGASGNGATILQALIIGDYHGLCVTKNVFTVVHSSLLAHAVWLDGNVTDAELAH